jgi:hypothetical protein
MADMDKEIFEMERTSIQKYDYFICSAAGALFAYVGEHYEPHKFDSTYSTLTPLALICLILSVGFGIKSIYLSNMVKRFNLYHLKHHEDCISITKKLTEFSASQNTVLPLDEASGKVLPVEYLTSRKEEKLQLMDRLEKAGHSQIKRAIRYERVRDICLMVGLVLIFCSKILQPYLSTK